MLAWRCTHMMHPFCSSLFLPVVVGGLDVSMVYAELVAGDTGRRFRMATKRGTREEEEEVEGGDEQEEVSVQEEVGMTEEDWK
jgi:hypothetical protein